MGKDRKLYKIVIGITALVIIIIGFEWNNILNCKPLVKYQILHNLKDKYEEEFEAVNDELNYSEEYGYDLKVCPKNEDKSKYTFDAYRNKNENGKYEYLDSYIGVLLKDEYESKINDIAELYFNEFKTVINYTSEPFSNEYTKKNMNVEGVEYNPPISIRVSPTFNNIEELESSTNLFIEEMKQNNTYGSVTIIYLNDNKYLESETIDGSMYEKRFRFYIDGK